MKVAVCSQLISVSAIIIASMLVAVVGSHVTYGADLRYVDPSVGTAEM